MGDNSGNFFWGVITLLVIAGAVVLFVYPAVLWDPFGINNGGNDTVSAENNPLLDRVEASIEGVDQDTKTRDLRQSLNDNGVNQNDASKIAKAVTAKVDKGVPSDNIISALDDKLDTDAKASDIVRVINSVKVAKPANNTPPATAGGSGTGSNNNPATNSGNTGSGAGSAGAGSAGSGRGTLAGGQSGSGRAGAGSAGSGRGTLAGGQSGSGTAGAGSAGSGGSQSSGEDSRIVPIIGPNAMTASNREARFNCPGPNGGKVPALNASSESIVAHSGNTGGNCLLTFESIAGDWAIEVDGSTVRLPKHNGVNQNSYISVVRGPLTNYTVYCEDCKITAAPWDVAMGAACQHINLADNTRSNVRVNTRDFDTSKCSAGVYKP